MQDLWVLQHVLRLLVTYKDHIIYVYTPEYIPIKNGPRTPANALSTEVTQNRMAQRHHLSKALVVSLLKNNYYVF